MDDLDAISLLTKELLLYSSDGTEVMGLVLLSNLVLSNEQPFFCRERKSEIETENLFEQKCQ